jgi:hypothetical protein
MTLDDETLDALGFGEALDLRRDARDSDAAGYVVDRVDDGNGRVTRAARNTVLVAHMTDEQRRAVATVTGKTSRNSVTAERLPAVKAAMDAGGLPRFVGLVPILDCPGGSRHWLSPKLSNPGPRAALLDGVPYEETTLRGD